MKLKTKKFTGRALAAMMLAAVPFSSAFGGLLISPSPDAGEQTFYGKSDVRFGIEKSYDVDAAVTVKDGIITKVVLSNNAKDSKYPVNAPYADKALAIAERFVGLRADDRRKIERMDAVTGATFSSDAYIEAVGDALDLENKEYLPEEDKDDRIYEGVVNTEISLTSRKVKGGIALTWKKSPGFRVDGYEVFRSTKKTKGYGTKAFFKTKKTSYRCSKALKKGRTYYFKVRGYRMIDGKKVYTKWSPVVSRKAI